jgi:hypothetical protein
MSSPLPTDSGGDFRQEISTQVARMTRTLARAKMPFFDLMIRGILMNLIWQLCRKTQ